VPARWLRRCLSLLGAAALTAVVAPAATAAPAPAPAGPAAATAGAGSVGTARVLRDEYGVPHVFAGTARALFYADGYAQAQDRLWQADLVRRTATGTLAELIGPGDGGGNVDGDVFFRHYTGGQVRLQRQVAALDRTTRAAVDAFVGGVNGWIAAATAAGSLPVEYAATGSAPRPFTAADVVAVGMLSNLQVGTTGGDELGNAAVLADQVARLGPAQGAAAFADSHWLDDPGAPTTIPGPAGRTGRPGSAGSTPAAGTAATATATGTAATRTTPAAGTTATATAATVTAATVTAAATGSRLRGAAGPALRLLRAAHRSMARLGLDSVGHSNAMALSGRLTRSGRPLLLGGPQIGHSLPQGFVEIGLHGAGFDATGVVLAGTPGVEIGVGRTFAWTVTTGGDDNQDWYAEQLDPAGHPGQYFFGGGWRRYDCHAEAVAVAGAAAVPVTLCESVHGPVLGQQGAVALALRDATRDGVPASLRGFLDIDRAGSLRQFLAAGRSIRASLNLTYADVAGHIAYAHVGPVPVRRPGDNPFLPHAGDGSAEWLGFLPERAMPLAVDPASGWLANWNNKPRPGWANSSDGFWQWGPVQRVQVIQRQLAAIAPHSATMATLEQVNRTTGLTAQTQVGEDHSVLVQALLAPMLAAVDGTDPALAAALARLRGWDQQQQDTNADGRFDDPALTIFNAWYEQFATATVVPVLGEAYQAGGGADDTTANVVGRLLAGPAAALPLRADYLHGASLRAAATASLRAALSELATRYGSADPAGWLTGAITIEWTPMGAGSVPRTPWMNRGTYNQIVWLLPSGIRAENVVAPGQSGDVRSPHFADQLRLYATWAYKPMRLRAADLAGHLSAALTLRPQTRRR
jgi:penicillin G amidase